MKHCILGGLDIANFFYLKNNFESLSFTPIDGLAITN